MIVDTKMLWLATCVVVTAQCRTSIALAEGTANSEAETVVDMLAFPEAPLFVNDRLHWVEYASNRLMRLDGEARTVTTWQSAAAPIRHRPGARQNGIRK